MSQEQMCKCLMNICGTLQSQHGQLNQMTHGFATALSGFRDEVTAQVVGVATKIADLAAKQEEHVKRLEELEDMFTKGATDSIDRLIKERLEMRRDSGSSTWSPPKRCWVSSLE